MVVFSLFKKLVSESPSVSSQINYSYEIMRKYQIEKQLICSLENQALAIKFENVPCFPPKFETNTPEEIKLIEEQSKDRENLKYELCNYIIKKLPEHIQQKLKADLILIWSMEEALCNAIRSRYKTEKKFNAEHGIQKDWAFYNDLKGIIIVIFKFNDLKNFKMVIMNKGKYVEEHYNNIKNLLNFEGDLGEHIIKNVKPLQDEEALETGGSGAAILSIRKYLKNKYQGNMIVSHGAGYYRFENDFALGK